MSRYIIHAGVVAKAPGLRRSLYLSGPIANCTQAEIHGWRDRVMHDFGHRFDFIDPSDFLADNTVPPSRVVETDLANIERCDALVANCWKRSYGTIMEIAYARLLGKIVVVQCPDLYPSPWLLYHKVFTLGSRLVQPGRAKERFQ